MIMRGTCDECAKRDNCKKEIGFMFGYCNTGFVQASGEELDERMIKAREREERIHKRQQAVEEELIKKQQENA